MQEEFREIVCTKELKKIGLDSVTSIADDYIGIPAVSALVRTYTSIVDKLFLKKAFNYLNEIHDLNWKQRASFINEMSDENSSGSEKLLLAIERLDTFEKSKYFGRLCKLRMTGVITLQELFRLTKVLQDAYIEDLHQLNTFENDEKKPMTKLLQEMSIDDIKRRRSEKYASLITLGLICDYEIANRRRLGNRKAKFTGIGSIATKYSLTELGRSYMKCHHTLFNEN